MSKASDARAERAKARQESREHIADMKYSAQTTAYQHGIDPNKAKYEAIAEIGKDAASVVGSIVSAETGGAITKSGKSGSWDKNGGSVTTDAAASSSSSTMMLAAAGVVLFLIFGKK